MPKRMTDKQLAANRRNALRSTGPRTAKGRAVSRMNALKHGILSKQVLVKGRYYCEDPRELEALYRRFHDEFQPTGPLEEMLVDQIVTAHWRLRRALTAESGEIALSVDNGQRKRNRGISPSLQWAKWTTAADATHAMRESSMGCAVLMTLLENVQASVEQEGRLTDEAVQGFAKRLGGRSNAMLRKLEELRQKQEAADADDEARSQVQADLLACLKREMNGLHRSMEMRADEEEQDDGLRQAAAVLPSVETLDKILRYETKLERQMYRAMAQLERVQRMRRGEAIPAPLSLEVSERG